MLLPLGESFFLGTPSLGRSRASAFMVGTLAVGILNYLPTRARAAGISAGR